MKTLLLVAHGSRKVSSNAAIESLTEKLRQRLVGTDFSAITHAFLELTAPSIPQGIASLVGLGATQVVVMPYFLAPGTHVVDDVPELINEAQSQYPEVRFTIMPYLGETEGIIDLILLSADQAD